MLLAMVAGLMFALGYYRHRQLLFPNFPPNHLRSVMSGTGELFLEGVLLHEPEKLPNRAAGICAQNEYGIRQAPKRFPGICF